MATTAVSRASGARWTGFLHESFFLLSEREESKRGKEEERKKEKKTVVATVMFWWRVGVLEILLVTGARIGAVLDLALVPLEFVEDVSV